MTTTSNHISGTDTGQAPHHTRDGSHRSTDTHPCRMPAGGWLKEVATSENWRTTTIVLRHRDRAAAPSSH
ncbi:hypothetical protein [Methanoregula sp.]|uniref:hypothetical protein n=1 Tax=Methanoregula sp. TaxID=2052170 RepID=UPI003C723097